jgi:predicted Zn-dependent protease
MALAALDTAAVARALALVATGRDDFADAYFETRAEAELPAGDGEVGLRVWREEGLAVRLVRGESTWLASRDALDAAALADALRSVARSLPPAFPAPAEAGEADGEPPPLDELAAFSGRLENALRRRYLAFPLRLATRWHARDSRVVTPRTASDVERERFASVEVRTPWGRAGALAPRLDEAAAEALAERLAARFRGREAPPPETGHPPLLLRPGATAVALHECVAHALEVDLLARSGSPLAADGLELGSSELDVLDDPGAAPAGVARAFDDEGTPTLRRWLLRRGRVAQPIADRAARRRWGDLEAGSGFRADRHSPPLPRSHHLELLAGEATEERLLELVAGGIEIVEIAAGALDPATGELALEVAGARRVRGGAPAEPVGPFRVRGHLAALLGGVVAVGAERSSAGAGWCAKGGQRRAVWATAPSIVVAGLQVAP